MLSAKPWTLEATIRLLLGIFVGWFAVGFAIYFGEKTKPDENSVWYVVSTTLAMHGPILVMVALSLRLEGISWEHAFGFRREGLLRVVALGVLAAVAFLPIGWLLQTASIHLLEIWKVKTVEQQAIQTLKSAQPAFNQIYLIVFSTVIAPPAEELLFRGVLYPTIKQCGYPKAALVGTSLLFGAIHGNLTILIPLTILAFALIALYELTDNLLTCIVAHATFNAANIVIFTIQNTRPVCTDSPHAA